MEKKWLVSEEAAEYLCVSESTIFRWVKAGRLPIYRVEGIARFKVSDLDAFMEAGRTTTTEGGDNVEES